MSKFQYRGECVDCGISRDLNLDGLCSKCHTATESGTHRNDRRKSKLDRVNQESLMGLEVVAEGED